ncbi:hypothetical protein [Xanthomonas phage Carpasina]|uniref:Uncharacterized protein n=4 Tax=Carpasinavirus TaxID=2733099 RepID=A0A858NR33_9CAUD|nr:hypothetical protein HOT16_gp78 [Xanthomonas phage Carpasina]YP_009819218.1 hypothetical protein HOV04_gp74 [Xanthomonas phage XcP1]QJB22146.1 hypothetical protein XccvBFoX6_gp88 [Xanthomonas phage FoX6]QJB22245.1 hypothetical protein XccvBFoX7_gp88 [Xanthomonas phage FoX7]AWD92473.1 hypothetical protein [Xanthomonas phage Carpasina]AWN08576.1 hypothetical protein XcP1_074 [Xanthomonas phage XcP1]
MEPDTLPNEMSKLSFAIAHDTEYNRYTELRVHGFHSSVAFRQAFPLEMSEGSLGIGRMLAVEFNPYVVSRLRDRLAEVKPQDLWNPNIAVHEIISLARDPFAKEASRIAAMKELNVMLSITIVDENGKTRSGRSLEDFYRDSGKAEQEPETGSQASTAG